MNPFGLMATSTEFTASNCRCSFQFLPCVAGKSGETPRGWPADMNLRSSLRVRTSPQPSLDREQKSPRAHTRWGPKDRTSSGGSQSAGCCSWCCLVGHIYIGRICYCSNSGFLFFRYGNKKSRNRYISIEKYNINGSKWIFESISVTSRKRGCSII